MRTLLFAALAAATLAPALGSAQQSAPAQGRQCFLMHDWRGWRPTNDEKSMYIRVGVNQVYRVDFARGCPGLRSPSSHLITDSSNGSGQVCSAIDLDIKVSEQRGFATPCIATGITPLTKADIAALPKNLTP